MRIALFVHCFFPIHFYGTETYTLELARHYRDAGYDITVVSAIFQGEQATGSALLFRYEYQGIPVVTINKNLIPHSRVKETYYQQEMRDVFARLLDELRPDVVHVTHLINHTAVLLDVLKQRNIATYVTFTDFFGFCLNNKLEGADGRLCHGPSASRSNCVACHLKAVAASPGAGWLRHAQGAGRAQAMAVALGALSRLSIPRQGPLHGLVDDIVQRPDILAGLFNGVYRTAVAPTRYLASAYQRNGIRVPLRIIHFGVDVDRRPKPQRTSQHVPVIGFIGQVAPHKGTDLLIAAFNRLPKGAARLRIYGQTDQDPRYMKQLDAMAQHGATEFAGTFPQENMADVLAEIDLLVIPSRWYENSPLVLLNALATHTPVLMADVAGMTEFLEPGVNGLAFERDSAEDLYQRLCDCVLKPEGLYAMAHTTHYERTSAMMANETLALYGNV